jgi:GntR family transcriptional regulator, rspAB operon transcriptional repressor
MGSGFGRAGKPSESGGLAAEAYFTVRERIVRGEMAIGQVISRRKVAAELGMSFLPVTEALIRLENEGLLESRPRVGTRVRVPTRQDVEGHYVVRAALEVQAAMMFAERASREERAELMKLARRVDALSAQAHGDRFVYAALHEKLHRLIAECARCAALSDAISRTSAIASTWLCATRASSRTNPPTHHQDLMKVLVNDTPGAASEAMRAHIRLSMENALRRLELYFRIHTEYSQEYSRTSDKSLSLDWLMPESDAPAESSLSASDLPTRPETAADPN